MGREIDMQRRKFITTAGVGAAGVAAASTVAAPAIDGVAAQHPVAHGGKLA